ncbi:hypothetical protein CXG81DRAFT_21504, partial [Caulochytrium protostelioides]
MGFLMLSLGHALAIMVVMTTCATTWVSASPFPTDSQSISSSQQEYPPPSPVSPSSRFFTFSGASQNAVVPPGDQRSPPHTPFDPSRKEQTLPNGKDWFSVVSEGNPNRETKSTQHSDAVTNPIDTSATEASLPVHPSPFQSGGQFPGPNNLAQGKRPGDGWITTDYNNKRSRTGLSQIMPNSGEGIGSALQPGSRPSWERHLETVYGMQPPNGGMPLNGYVPNPSLQTQQMDGNPGDVMLVSPVLPPMTSMHHPIASTSGTSAVPFTSSSMLVSSGSKDEFDYFNGNVYSLQQGQPPGELTTSGILSDPQPSRSIPATPTIQMQSWAKTHPQVAMSLQSWKSYISELDMAEAKVTKHLQEIQMQCDGLKEVHERYKVLSTSCSLQAESVKAQLTKWGGYAVRKTSDSLPESTDQKNSKAARGGPRKMEYLTVKHKINQLTKFGDLLKKTRHNLTEVQVLKHMIDRYLNRLAYMEQHGNTMITCFQVVRKNFESAVRRYGFVEHPTVLADKPTSSNKQISEQVNAAAAAASTADVNVDEFTRVKDALEEKYRFLNDVSETVSKAVLDASNRENVEIATSGDALLKIDPHYAMTILAKIGVLKAKLMLVTKHAMDAKQESNRQQIVSKNRRNTMTTRFNDIISMATISAISIGKEPFEISARFPKIAAQLFQTAGSLSQVMAQFDLKAVMESYHETHITSIYYEYLLKETQVAMHTLQMIAKLFPEAGIEDPASELVDHHTNLLAFVIPSASENESETAKNELIQE